MNKNRCIISGVDVFDLPFKFNEDSKDCQAVKQRLASTIAQLHGEGVDEFYTDCSYGFPLWGGEMVVGLMKYNDIMLYVVCPYENQAYEYASDWQDRYYKVHEQSTDVIPMYIEYDEVEDTRQFSDESEETLYKKAADYMLGDCGRLIFCGDNPDVKKEDYYIYRRAVELKYDIKTVQSN